MNFFLQAVVVMEYLVQTFLSHTPISSVYMIVFSTRSAFNSKLPPPASLEDRIYGLKHDRLYSSADFRNIVDLYGVSSCIIRCVPPSGSTVHQDSTHASSQLKYDA